MEVEEFGPARGLALVASLLPIFAEWWLGDWAVARWNPISGDGGGAVMLVFVVLPLAAGGLGCWSLWRLSRAAAILSGLGICATAFFLSAMGTA